MNQYDHTRYAIKLISRYRAGAQLDVDINLAAYMSCDKMVVVSGSRHTGPMDGRLPAMMDRLLDCVCIRGIIFPES